MKVSKVVLIVVALHVLVIGGIFIFEGCARSKAPAADLTDNGTPADEQTAANATAQPVPQPVEASAPAPSMTPPTPAPAPTVASAAPVTAPAATARTYVVKKGDSLWKIAKAEGVSMGDLARANNITKTSALKPGQKLQVPAVAKADTGSAMTTASAASTTGEAASDSSSQMYVVKSGDSLWKISRTQNISVAALKQANSLSSDSLKVGQKLHIPSTTTPAGATMTTASKGSPQPTVNAGIATASYSDWHEPGTAVENGQTVHYVDAGESPAIIAKKYGVKVDDLMKMNNITDAKRIYVGEKLVIPSGQPQTTQPAAAASSAPAPSTPATPAVAAPIVPAATTSLNN